MWKTKREARLTKKFMLSIVTTRMKKRQEKKLIDPKEGFLDQRARNVNESDSNVNKNLENILCALLHRLSHKTLMSQIYPIKSYTLEQQLS